MGGGVALLAVLVLAPGAVIAAAHHPAAHHPTVRMPPANARFDYQIGGAYRPRQQVGIVDRDHTAHPAPGVYDVCSVNAYQTQAGQDHWWRVHHRRLLLHGPHRHLVEDPGWPGEYLLDTGTAAKRASLVRVVGRWIDGCRRKGFDAVEPDNLDSYTRSHHLLSRADNFAFARLLVARAHGDGLAIAQKNDAEASRRGARSGFDFAIAEECQVYDECHRYLAAYDDEVYEIEYTDNGRAAYHQACAARGKRISVILRDRDVTPRGSTRYRYRAC